jgi:hypothetical protein
MLYIVIICCEIFFWVFLISGLLFRYVLKKPKAGLVLLALSPVVDTVLLVTTVIDLRNGAAAAPVHALAAIYLGMSIVYGKRIIAWADARFAHRFGGGEPPQKPPKYGETRAKAERAGWLRHALMFAISCALMTLLAVLSGSMGETINTFKGVVKLWGIILIIDFIVSFSYTVFPRNER